MAEGWVAVYRSVLDPDHELHPSARGEQACRAFAWIDLVGMARWEPGGGLQRGQTRIKQRELASRWNWSRGKVRRFLDAMEAAGSISTDPQSGPKPTVVTVCNYDDYQFSTSATGPQSGPRVDPTTINDEEEKYRGRTPARDSAKTNGRPSGPGDISRSRHNCPFCSETLNVKSRGLYCPSCAEFKDPIVGKGSS